MKIFELKAAEKQQKGNSTIMKKNDILDEKDKMRREYDFSEGVRGKHFKKYRKGHSVKIVKYDGATEVHYFTQEDGAVMLDPDIKKHFPDSEIVNKTLRSLISQH
jgi:hypothetical protein